MVKTSTLSSLLLLGMFALAVSVTAGDHIVGTDVTKKNVLMEDFTGIHCTYCPDGHKIAARMHRNHPEQVYVLAIHAGNYATPGRDEPDFRTKEGTEVNDGFGVTGYPAGIVNRTLYSESKSGLVINRSLWPLAAKEQMVQDAGVNLAATAQYDGNTKKLTVHVEGYYTKVEKAWTPRLTVVLARDHIQGPQTGGQLGEDYIHNHVVRAYLNGTWGEELAAPVQGQYFEKELVYEVPEYTTSSVTSIKIPVRPEDLRIVAYVTNGNEDVQQVTGCVPACVNYAEVLRGTLGDPRIPMGSSYGYNFIEVNFDNHSSVPATSATFLYEAKGKKVELEWKGELAAGESADIRIPWTLDTTADDEDFTLTLKKINGTAVSPINDAYVDYIEGNLCMPNVVPAKLHLYIKTNKEAEDNHFLLCDADGKTVREFGPFKSGEVNEYEEDLTLEDGKTYCLEVTDEWGNGISGPAGQFKISNMSGGLEAQVPSISYFGARAFFITSEAAGVEGVEMSGTGAAKYYRLDGRLTNAQPEGVSIVKVQGGKAVKVIK